MNTPAAQFVQTLRSAHVGLITALESVVTVESELVAMATRPHLTTLCHVGAHPACDLRCSCRDCEEPCECSCHLPKAEFRA